MYFYRFNTIKLLHNNHWINLKIRATTLSHKQKQWVTFKVSALEMRALEEYCQQTQRTKTDLLRELIRNLPTYSNTQDNNLASKAE